MRVLVNVYDFFCGDGFIRQKASGCRNANGADEASA
jgi:hypothetical protein